ncbi:MAG: hypothetical protein L6R28_22915 [Planctomycetes bacterium]|nr:hypothetical protein [Planctomycetota bacterium]
MNGANVAVRIVAGLAMVLCAGAAFAASDYDEFKVKREAVFEFSQAPQVVRQGDRIAVRFETKGFCDVTVAVENGAGTIIRHLASGVLGENAPEPFAKGSKKQEVVWDGKDDLGKYVDDKDSHAIRVSLGLKPQFERTLFWSPYKRTAHSNPPCIQACEDGVLVYEGEIYDMVRLYDHQGNYVRTVYPFAADKLETVKDLHWAEFPQDGKRLPFKEWFRQATLLTSGTNCNINWKGFGEQRRDHDGHGAGADHHAASAIAVRGKSIALAMMRLNRLTMDGGVPGGKLGGPQVFFNVTQGGLNYLGGNDKIDVGPTSMAFSPDGEWLYLTGYYWIANFGTGGKKNFWLHGVMKMKYDGSEEPTLFAGQMKTDGDGTDDAHFSVPTSVACDASGRVYVSDYMNDRIQVFLPDGKLFKSLKAKKPAKVAVHPKTGEVFAFSWVVSNWRLQKSGEKVEAQIARLGTLDKPAAAPAVFPFKLLQYGVAASSWSCGMPYSAEVDGYADEPTVWLYPGHNVLTGFTGYTGQAGGMPYWQTTGVQVYTFKGGKLEFKHDFGRRAVEEIQKTSKVVGTGRNLCVNPRTGKLWVGDGSATIGFSWSLSVEIDPETGKEKLVELPFDCEQMVFDLEGQAYLRAKDRIVRYDPHSWREVPFDYGEEVSALCVSTTDATGPGRKVAKDVISALTMPSWEHAPQGTFSINARGEIVVPIKGKQVGDSGLVFRKGQEPGTGDGAKPYQFKLFPGRSTGGLIVVFDRHGKVINDDAIPGLTFTHGVKIDKDGDLYAMALATRVLDGKPYFNPATATMIKFRPGDARVLGTYDKNIPVPIPDADKPQGPPQLVSGGKPGLGQGWVKGAQWLYGGVGYNGEHHKNPDFGCDCCHSSFDLDYFARTFAPEVEHCSVAVLDSAGNLILRVGAYGNVEDGKPLVAEGGPAGARSIGGDEVGLFYAPHVAVHTDRRLFIADLGNERIAGVKLGYHTDAKVELKDVKDQASE